VAITVLTNCKVTYNSVDLSDHVESVEVDMTSEDVDITAMGATSRVHAPGLRDDKITLNLFQDFAATKVDATISPLVGSAAGAVMVILPNNAAVSSTNPSYTATVAPFTYKPLSGQVGAASQTSVEFLCCAGGAIVRAVS
jgi:hypothetical protein